ncbi:MAG: hypothetical protein LBL52_01030 [Rickettsiales bacterium]|jgi:hypothetical protein|nr:hypothetical protein [Rickettsiales bacterium]
MKNVTEKLIDAMNAGKVNVRKLKDGYEVRGDGSAIPAEFVGEIDRIVGKIVRVDVEIAREIDRIRRESKPTGLDKVVLDKIK